MSEDGLFGGRISIDQQIYESIGLVQCMRSTDAEQRDTI